MGQTWQPSVQTAEPALSGPVPELPDYGWNSENRSSTGQDALATPLLDAAAQETGEAHASPAPLGALGLGLGGLVGCAPSDPIDAQVDAAIASSPKLTADVATIRNQGYRFESGKPGGGTFTLGLRIVVDPNELADPVRFSRAVAHEVGHALDGPTKYQDDPRLDRQTYIDVNTRLDLEGEAHATIEELEVRDEVMANNPGQDPGISGATAVDKIAAWSEFQAGRIDRATLVDRLVNLFATGEKPSDDPTAKNYWDFYARFHAEAWDRAHPAGP